MKTLTWLTLLTLLTLSGCRSMLKHEAEYQRDKAFRKHMKKTEGDKSNLEIYGDRYVEDKGSELVIKMGNAYMEYLCRIIQWVAGGSLGSGGLVWLLSALKHKKKNLLIKELKQANGNGGKA